MQNVLRQIAHIAQQIHQRTSQHTSLLASKPIVEEPVIPLILEEPSLLSIVDELVSAGGPKNVAKQLAQVYCSHAHDLSLKCTEIYSRNRVAAPQIGAMYERRVAEWRLGLITTVRTRFGPKEDAGITPPSQPKEKLSFNRDFLPQLEYYFSHEQSPSRADKNAMAKKSGMTYRQIHVWFQNRRTRAKKLADGLGEQRRGPNVIGKSANKRNGPNVGSKLECSEKLARLPKTCSSAVAGNENVFPYVTPPYAFPARYPPHVAPDADPFPCRYGDFSFLSGVRWERTPTTMRKSQDVPNIISLVAAFERLAVGDRTVIDASECSRSPRSSHSPSKMSGCDVTGPYTVRPLHAPLFSLVRCPMRCDDSGECATYGASSDGHMMTVRGPIYNEESLPSGSRQHAILGTGLDRSLVRRHITMLELSTLSGTISKVVEKGSMKKKSESARHTPSEPAVKRRKGRTASMEGAIKGLSSVPFARSSLTPTSSAPLYTSLSSSDLLPSLTYSSSDSSASSETHSPVFSAQQLSDEGLPPSVPVDIGLSTASRKIERFQLPASLSSEYPFAPPKGPLGGVFGYGLPEFQSYLQSMDALS
ncbi:hypothetical protein M0805_001381 [Coniferiporia weirii]|nr:hypothetical protein M0805_001381 [Coniferiporia weirii]